MTRLLIVARRLAPGEPLGGLGGALRRAAERLLVVPTHDDRAGVAIVHGGGSGLLTVDLALPGLAGFRCVTALGGGSSDIPILAIHDTSPSRERALRLAHIAGWPSTLGLPPREFDRLMSLVRRCGRLKTQPERQYHLNVRVVGFLVAGGVRSDDHGA